MRRKICVVTGTRAEYGLLYWLMRAIEECGDLELQLIVTGSHLSMEHGETYKTIEFTIDKKIDIALSDDSAVGISRSMGLAMSGFGEAFSELKPDLVVLLGDRYEIFCAAAAALVALAPVAHLHGGERSEGAFDEAFRHSITKMSHLHFCAADEYKQRIIQLGENPQMVHNVGGMGIENIKKLKLLSKEEFEKSIEFHLAGKNLLVTFHPATLDGSSAQEQLAELLSALDALEQTHLIFTKANSDTDGKAINAMLEEFVRQNSHKAALFASLGQLRYLSALQFMDAVVGNSSSGLIEAPSFNIGTIDIGQRQMGRLKASSVIECDPTRASIDNALAKLYSSEFQESLKSVQNPYGDGCASEKIVEVLKSIDLNNLIKKRFYDLASYQGKGSFDAQQS